MSVSDLRDLDIDDLLRREPVAPNHILLGRNIVGKTVLVTGAGGFPLEASYVDKFYRLVPLCTAGRSK